MRTRLQICFHAKPAQRAPAAASRGKPRKSRAMDRPRKRPTAATTVMRSRDMWRFILPFLGPGLHAFSPVSKGCHAAYIDLYPDKRTSIVYLCSNAALLAWAAVGRHGYKLSTQTCAIAARAGSLDTLAFARANGCPINYSTGEAAAASGHLAVLQWMHEETGGRYWRARMGGLAARNGHLELLQWVLATCGRKGVDASLCSGAAAGEHMHVLEWAHASQLPWDSFTCDACAREGNLEMLQWARERDCPWGATTVAAAAGAGHMYIVQWLLTSGCAYNEKACAAAAGGGHPHVLQYLRGQQHTVPWTQKACTAAARNGHLHVLQWAVARQCRWHPAKLLEFGAAHPTVHLFAQAIIQGTQRFGPQHLNAVHPFFDPLTYASNMGQLSVYVYVQAMIAWQRAGLFFTFMDLIPHVHALTPEQLAIAPAAFVAAVIAVADQRLPPGEEAAEAVAVALHNAVINAAAAAAAQA